MKNQKVLKLEGLWNAEFVFTNTADLFKVVELMENATQVDSNYVGSDFADGGSVAVLKKQIRCTISTVPTVTQEEYAEIKALREAKDAEEKAEREAKKVAEEAANSEHVAE